MIERWKNHWPLYLIEAASLMMFMISACTFATLLQHPASPVRQAIPSATVRRGLMGLAMGLTAIALIYSPTGKRSGAHINPAVTLTFYRLNKVETADVFFYIGAQLVGAVTGVTLSHFLLWEAPGHPAVGYVVTRPGGWGIAVAFLAEMIISAGLMSTVVFTSNHPRLKTFTGLFAGLLVASYILVEAPISGMSMNPARTLGSAVVANVWTAIWIYFTAPLLGMLLAAEIHRRSVRRVHCAKLQHDHRVGTACHFKNCGQDP